MIEFEFTSDRSQIAWLLDDIIVVGEFVAMHRLSKIQPDICVFHQFCNNLGAQAPHPAQIFLVQPMLCVYFGFMRHSDSF